MGVERPATATPCTPQQLVDALVQVWPSELGGTPSLEAACILAAQWALETAEGKDCIAFNIGNAKCADPEGEDFCFFTTEEDLPAAVARELVATDPRCSPKGTWADDATTLPVLFHPKHPTSRFRAFGSLAEGVQVYLRGMWSHWTQAWPAVCQGDPEGFAAGLRQMGYYTAPETAYAADMRHYFDKYLPTLRVPTVPPDAPTQPAPASAP